MMAFPVVKIGGVNDLPVSLAVAYPYYISHTLSVHGYCTQLGDAGDYLHIREEEGIKSKYH